MTVSKASPFYWKFAAVMDNGTPARLPWLRSAVAQNQLSSEDEEELQLQDIPTGPLPKNPVDSCSSEEDLETDDEDGKPVYMVDKAPVNAEESE